MNDSFCVKGSSIRSKFDYVRDTFGPRAELELKESFSASDDIGSVLDSGLYPFDLYDRVLWAVAERFLDGDVNRLREVGAYSAEKSLTSIYRAFAEGKDFLGFLSRIQLLHQRFYTHGTMAVDIGDGNKSTRITLTGAPTYSDADLQVAAGFYLGVGNLLGLESIRLHFERTDHGAVFDLSWA
ncbi:MAG: hypothetical protein OES47_06510 [Acidobacteriota bacterium]|nr:hypothetical protein [Acidobacteriota bacterium]